MKKILILFAAAILLQSCFTTQYVDTGKNVFDDFIGLSKRQIIEVMGVTDTIIRKVEGEYVDMIVYEKVTTITKSDNKIHASGYNYYSTYVNARVRQHPTKINSTKRYRYK